MGDSHCVRAIACFTTLVGMTACSSTSSDENHDGQLAPDTTPSGMGGAAGSSIPNAAGNAMGEGGDRAGGNVDSGGVGNAGSGGRQGTGGRSGDSGIGGNGGSKDGGSLGVGGFSPVGTPPVLTPGIWKNITPPGLDLPVNPPPFGIPIVEMDPSNTATLYLCVDTKGIWKTTDAGTSWAVIGDTSFKYAYDFQTKYLDSPVAVRVDPRDPRHLYATQGVRGSTLGFWVSTDGGATWAWPPGFKDIAKTTTNDITNMAVDPNDFKHVLVASHSPWANNMPAGILETRDGGNTFLAHHPSWSVGGSLGVNFLYSPELGIGNSQTWLIGTDGGGFWRTTDSGTTWAQVSSHSAVHGGNHGLYFTKAGVIYSGANNQMMRSTDQGSTWTTTGPSFADGYYQVIGDGNVLYAQEANTGKHTTAALQPYITSPETDGLTWTPYQGGAQTFSDGPYSMAFDPVNRIIYSANWDAGFWALKVLGN
jgi:hypothetical protein